MVRPWFNLDSTLKILNPPFFTVQWTVRIWKLSQMLKRVFNKSQRIKVSSDLSQLIPYIIWNSNKVLKRKQSRENGWKEKDKICRVFVSHWYCNHGVFSAESGEGAGWSVAKERGENGVLLAANNSHAYRKILELGLGLSNQS